MKNILVANIGNRNLSAHGKSIMELPEAKCMSFKGFTEKLKAEKRYENLRLEILDKVVLPPHAQKRFDRIFLIGTDQSDASQTVHAALPEKDTLGAAEIVAEMLKAEDHLRDTEIHAIGLHALLDQVTDVMRWYKQFFNSLLNLYPEASYTLIDSGGAPQMKQAMKLTAEYLLGDTPFEVLYVSAETGKAAVVPNIEYKKIIASYQVETLIGKLNYEGALQVWRESEETPDPRIIELLQFGSKIRNYVIEGIVKDAKSLEALLKNSATADYIYSLKTAATGAPLRHTIFYRAAFILAHAEKCVEMNDYNNLVLSARQFMEYTVAGILSENLNHHILKSDAKAKELIKDLFSRLGLKQDNRIPDWHSFGYRKEALKKAGDPAVAVMMKSFDRLDSHDFKANEGRTLSALRNQLAHFGKAITKSDIKKKCTALPMEVMGWRSMFGFVDANPFDILNTEISLELKDV